MLTFHESSQQNKRGAGVENGLICSDLTPPPSVSVLHGVQVHHQKQRLSRQNPTNENAHHKYKNKCHTSHPLKLHH